VDSGDYVRIYTPLTDDTIRNLKTGDNVYINGTIYTARDAAHKKLVDHLQREEDLPFDPSGQIIFYVGPAPAKPGAVIGPAGPTTSYRMDPYTVPLLKAGLKGMIGKGPRSQEVKQAIGQYSAVYFAAIGGAAALISQSIVKADVIAYPELGTEAVRRLEVQDLPVIVVNDAHGGDLYTEGVLKYRRKS